MNMVRKYKNKNKILNDNKRVQVIWVQVMDVSSIVLILTIFTRVCERSHPNNEE